MLDELRGTGASVECFPDCGVTADEEKGTWAEATDVVRSEHESAETSFMNATLPTKWDRRDYSAHFDGH